VVSSPNDLSPPARPITADSRHQVLLLATSAWTAAGVILYLLAPRAAPGVLALCVVAPIVWHRAAIGQRFIAHAPSAVFIVLGLAGVYLLINATWSLSRATAYEEIAWLLLFIAALYVTLTALSRMPAEALSAMAAGFLVGVAAGGAFLAFEAFSQQAVHRWLINAHPAWAPDPRHLRIEDGVVRFLEPHLLNRSTTALALVFWPGVLAATALRIQPRPKILLVFGLALAAATIFRSEHATAKIALVVAAATYGLFLLSATLTRRAVIAGWIGMTLLVVPLAMLAYSQELYRAGWLPSSARQRVVIWGYTSEQVTKAPLLGAGVSSARALNRQDDATPRAPGTKYRLTTGWHSHNGYLQAWYETGAVGALLLLALGLVVLKGLARAPVNARPALFATFVSCALVGASSFSLWAPWFIASFGLAAVFASLGAELVERTSNDP